MRCLSHIFLLKKEKCFKNYYPGMEKTRICYFCLKKIKKIYGYTLQDLMNKELYKKFIKTGSLSPEYFPLSIGISE